MPFAVDPNAAQNILVATFYPPVDVDQDHHALLAESVGRLEEGHTPLYRVLDFRSAYLNFSDMIRWLAADTAHHLPGAALDPQVRTVLVSNSEDTDRIAEWLEQDQYGGLHIPLFSSIDDALNYVSQQIVG